MKWSSKTINLSPEAFQARVFQDGRPLSHERVHFLWETSPDFAQFYASTILESGFESLCWETPPVSRANITMDHEFVVVESPMLKSRAADPTPFREHLIHSSQKVVSFPNLGRNGTMIVPVPPRSGANYNHFVSFLRTAPSEAVAELFRVTAYEIKVSLDEKPRWLSTAGLGVSWLHVRIDTRPKYYRHEPYRNPAG